jgi:hypothetical protein
VRISGPFARDRRCFFLENGFVYAARSTKNLVCGTVKGFEQIRYPNLALTSTITIGKMELLRHCPYPSLMHL